MPETNSNNQLLLRLSFINQSDFPDGKYTTDYSIVRNKAELLLIGENITLNEKRYEITGVNVEMHNGTFIQDRATHYLGEIHPYNTTITLYLK